MIDQKQLAGILNTDDENNIIPQSHHKMAKNIRFRGNAGNMRPESCLGTTEIEIVLPSGTNTPIGGFYDQLRNRIIWFNHNSNTYHGIYQYSLTTKIASKLFLCFTDSATDILRFNLQYPIHSCAIVYRDEADGDLLYWTDGNTEDDNRPRYLNLATVSTLAPFTEDMINAAKNAPSQRAVCTYGNDTARPTNTLKKKLFQFRYRWIYANNEKSTCSPYSRVALPFNYSDVDTENDPTNNNYISILVRTGGADVQKLQIIGRESIGDNYGDDFIITTIDKDDYPFTENSSYTYDFYNDEYYVTLDKAESSLLFDWLPDNARTLELLNGNVIVYGGIVDGYDAILKDGIDVSITTYLGNVNAPSITYNYDGTTTITLIIGTVITTGIQYNVDFDYVSGLPGDSSPKNVTYTTLVSDSRNDIALGLKALIEGNNVTVVNPSSGVLRVSVPFGGTISNVVVSTSYSGSENATPSFNWLGQYRLGLIYFDDRMKTNGVVSFVGDAATDSDFSVTMPSFSGTNTNVLIPIISAAINHTPPTWATSYQWVITPNLLTQKDLYFISCDYQTDTDFIYVGIQNLYYLGTKNSGFVPTYDFSKGDRVKIYSAYSGGNYTTYNIALDFEILGVEDRTMTNPAIMGTFLKLNKPTTFPSVAYSANMLIYIYTPSINNSEENQFFYEFGETYSIYESGGERYHTGDITNQTSTQPATFQFYRGDVYFKTRNLYLLVNDTTTVSAQMMDRNFNDYYSSAVNSFGRQWVIDPDAKETQYPATYRWGGAFQDNTNINDLNRFYPENFDDIDRGKGWIQRFKIRDRILKIFQERGVGQVGVYTKFIQDSSNTSVLTTTDSIITSNNVQYYKGERGIGNQPTSLVSSRDADYFVDPVTGDQIRSSNAGLDSINELYKGQYFIRNLLTPYYKTWSRPDGSNAKILGCFDVFEQQYMTVLQSGARFNNDNPLSFVENGVNTSVVSPGITIFIETFASASYIVAFNGTAQTGDVVTIHITATNLQEGNYSQPLISGDDLFDLRDNLVAEVNSESFYTGATADQSGNAGLSITNDLTSNILTDSSFTDTTITHPVYLITFTGGPSVNDFITVILSDTNGGTATFDYRVTDTDTKSTICQSIVDLINNQGLFTAHITTYNGYTGLYAESTLGYVVSGSSTITHPNNDFLTPYTFSFNELRNSYCSFYDFFPDWIVSAQELMFSWANGKFYVHNNSGSNRNFYGTAFNPSIKLVFNDRINIKKTYNSIGYQSERKLWVSDDVGSVNTSYINQQTGLRQQSNLLDSDYVQEENTLVAAFQFDANSDGGLNEGDVLKGVWIEIEFTYKGGESAFIYLPYINWSVSQRNF